MTIKVIITNSAEFHEAQMACRRWARQILQDLDRDMNGGDIESAQGSARELYHSLTAMKRYWF